MGKYGFIVLWVLLFVSNLCNGSAIFHLRKLITSEQDSSSSNPQISPTGGPVDNPNTNPMHSGKPEEVENKEPHKANHSDTKPLPVDTKNTSEKSGDQNPSAGKVDRGDEPSVNETGSKLDNNDCERSLTSCRDKEMFACVKPSKDGSKEFILVVQNDGESTFKVDKGIPPTVGKHAVLIVNSGNAKCELGLVNPVSVDNLIQQLSSYSKQVTPIYAAYASFLFVLLFGGTWACCKLRKNRGIPYQELEMGSPEPASAANVDAAEGWDHEWDNDNDWDEETAVKSPAGHQIKSVSADGLTSRPPKKDGWDNDWED